MKPSRRRDSLERAARKEAYALVTDPAYPMENTDMEIAEIAKALVDFAQRHGAKVRRETLKEMGKKL